MRSPVDAQAPALVSVDQAGPASHNLPPLQARQVSFPGAPSAL